MREARGLLGAVLVALLAYAGLELLLALQGDRADHLAILAACLGIVVAGWYAYDSAERTTPPTWPAPPLPAELPTYPSDYRTRRLQTMVHNGLGGQRLARSDLANELADVAAGRLVARHGADPQDPLRDVAAHTSPGLAAYLAAAADPDTVPPRLKRATLTAYLKEIEQL